MKTADIIALFVGDEHSLEILRRPICRGEYVYAANGHIAVRVRDDGSIDCANAREGGILSGGYASAGIERLLQADYFRGGFPLAEALQTSQCVAELGPCEGCAGSGITPAGQYEPEGSVCIICDGDGTDWRDVRRQIGHAWYSPRYLKRLALLPGATLRETGRADEAALIEFDDGLALMMPMQRALVTS